MKHSPHSFISVMTRGVVLAVLLSSMTADAAAQAGARPIPFSENIPVPGGVEALTRALGIESPGKGGFVAELARQLYRTPDRRTDDSSRRLGQLTAYLAKIGPAPSTDLVPLPLDAATWNRSILRRPAEPRDLFAAVMTERPAALMACGLASVDDPTLEYLRAHPALLTRLAARSAAVFGAFARSVHVNQGRIVVPGGAEAEPLWEAVVGERIDPPEQFIVRLFEEHDGRLAYLYDAIAGLDEPHARFALGTWLPDLAMRRNRFLALAKVSTNAFPEFNPLLRPLTRPAFDLAILLARLGVEPDGTPSAPSDLALWGRVFGAPDRRDERDAARGSRTLVDVAWLAEQVLTRDVPTRRRRLDTISFAQRTFAGVPERAFDDVVTTLAEFGRLQALMLTLDRLKIADPAIYAAAARRAATLDRLDRSHAFRSLAQFQSALTFVVQLRRGRTIDRAVTERLVQSLVSLDVHDDGYRCGMAAWIDEALMPSLPRAEDASASLEGRLLAAMSGVGSTASPQVSDVAWEGQMYRLDLAGAEMRRMAQVRSKQRGKSLDDAMAFARDARGRARTGEAMRACDEMVGRVLISLAYAIHLGDGEGTVLLGGDVSQRHDFGLTSPVAEVRRRTPWATPDPQSQAGVPWHVSGSVLALDVGLSSLALRSVSGGGIADRADVIKDFDRKAFSDSVALLDPLDLTEDARAGIVAALARGRARIARLEDHPEEAGRVFDDVHSLRVDGGRQRAIRWTLVNDPRTVDRWFSLSEVLVLGKPAADLHAWGMSGIPFESCYCSRLQPVPPWQIFTGQLNTGVLPARIADLNLRIAEMSAELKVPAVLSRGILAAAVEDYLDDVQPSDYDDWMAFVRAARRVPRERVEDYTAALTANGPLVPAADREDRQ